MNVLAVERDLERLKAIRAHRYLKEEQIEVLDTLIDDISSVLNTLLSGGTNGEQSGDE